MVDLFKLLLVTIVELFLFWELNQLTLVLNLWILLLVALYCCLVVQVQWEVEVTIGDCSSESAVTGRIVGSACSSVVLQSGDSDVAGGEVSVLSGSGSVGG